MNVRVTVKDKLKVRVRARVVIRDSVTYYPTDPTPSFSSSTLNYAVRMQHGLGPRP